MNCVLLLVTAWLWAKPGAHCCQVMNCQAKTMTIGQPLGYFVVTMSETSVMQCTDWDNTLRLTGILMTMSETSVMQCTDWDNTLRLTGILMTMSVKPV